MKIFILENVTNLTTHYHPEGGAVVIAKDKETAKKLLYDYDGETLKIVEVTQEEWDAAIEYDCSAKEEKVFIFPDAGCC